MSRKNPSIPNSGLSKPSVEWSRRDRDGRAFTFDELITADNRVYRELLAAAECDLAAQSKQSPSDVVQETMVDAQRSFGDFRGENRSKWRSWLLSILKYNLLDKRRRFVDSKKRTTQREVAGVNIATLTGSESSSDLPLNQLIKRATISNVTRSLEQLRPEQQELLRLRYWQQKSFHEIGKIQHLTGDAARKALYRSVDALAKVIAANEQQGQHAGRTTDRG